MYRMLHEVLQSPFPYVIGLIVTVGLGIVVDFRLNGMMKAFQRKPPTGMTPESWEALLEWPETYGGIVHWLGLLERIFFFTVLHAAFPLFVPGWLIFKLGCYWAVWHSILRGMDRVAEMSSTDLMVVQSRRANALATACVFRTLGNLLVAFLGVLFTMAAMHF